MTTVETSSVYSFNLSGDKPMDILKEKIADLKANEPEHPMLKAKGVELVAVPDGVPLYRFVREFLDSTAEADKIYIAILKLGAFKETKVKSMQPTGKCRVNETIHKGARQWETHHVVYINEHVKDSDGMRLYDEQNLPILRPVELGSFPTKGEAMALAKQYSIDHVGEKTFVKLEKRLNGSDPHMAEIEAMMKEVTDVIQEPDNTYAFFGKG